MRGFWTGLFTGAIVVAAATMWLRPNAEQEAVSSSRMPMGRSRWRKARQAFRRGADCAADLLEEALE